ncbi:MAG: hydroxyphenylacetyl-CoA thioesterase PaaI [Proteobacteria bacterium]|nr:hydroxyphenylacetyl-CoA thioesterase PaaI [Pseudomonadota bacterium]
MDADELARACADAMYSDDRASGSLGMSLDEVSAGRAVMFMTVRDDMLNSHGLCHGGLIFTLADSAFAYACNSQNQNTVASGVRVEFLATAHLGDTLTALAEQVSQAGRTGIYDVRVSNQNNKVVALFRGNSHRIGGALVNESTGEPV